MSTVVQTPPRLAWVDAAKVLGMVAIYVGHMQGNGALFGLVYAFHVPLFFLLSGLFAPRATARPWLRSVHRRTVTILVPFLVFTLCHLAVYVLSRPTRATDDQIRSWLDLAWQGSRGHLLAPGLWFFPALWLIAISYDALARLGRRLVGNAWPWLVLAVAVVGHVLAIGLTQDMREHPWSWNWALLYLAYYALGGALSPLLLRIATPGGRVRELGWTAVGLVATALAAVVYVVGPQGLSAVLGHTARTWPPLARGAHDAFLALVLMAGVIALARQLAGIGWLVGMGQRVLVYCGAEAAMKLAVTGVAGVLCLKVVPVTPLQAVLWALVVLAFVELLVARWAQPALDRLATALTPPSWGRRG